MISRAWRTELFPLASIAPLDRQGATLIRPAEALIAVKKPPSALFLSGWRHHLILVGGIIPLPRATSSRFGGRLRQISTLARLLIGKRVGEAVELDGREIEVVAIE